MSPRLLLLVSATLLAGVLAMAAIALGYSFQLVFACLCGSTGAAFALLVTLKRQQVQLEQMNQALGMFMRGNYQARAEAGDGDDAFARLQHRINNLLDLLDLHARGDEAAIDRAAHEDYLEKLQQTALAETLAGRRVESAAKDTSVGALLQQLGHDVANLFADEIAAPAPAEAEMVIDAVPLAALTQWQQELYAAALRLQQACTDLAQRAQLPTPAGVGPSPATLEAALARLAEQTTVIALNVSIEAGRAPDHSSLHASAEELQGMAALLHKARGEVAAALAPHHRQPGPVTVPLAVAVEALAVAEQEVRARAEAITDLHNHAPLALVQEAA